MVGKVANDEGKPKGPPLSFEPEGEVEPPEITELGKVERLNHYLARCGVASRRRCARLIREGKVTVNGQIVVEPSFPVRVGVDEVKVEGKRVRGPEPKVYIILNKPKGYLTVMKTPDGRACVGDLVKRVKFRVVPVGRLDRDTEGLLLLTNDGELAHKLLHPAFKVPRRYMVRVRGQVSPKTVKKLRSGVELSDGPTMPAKVHVRRRGENFTVLRMTLYEGRHHEIKRMCKAVGHPVIELKRTGFANLELGDLPPGKFRYLLPAEVKKLRKFAGLE